MRKVALALALLLASAVAFAGDVDGKWSGTISTDQGQFPVEYTFKTDGATLTGTTTGPDGAVIMIKNGKVRRFKFHHTVYSGRELRDRMEQSGFSEVKLYGSLKGDEYGPSAERLVAVGRKAGR